MQKNNITNRKVALSGGHAATSALAVIEKIQERHPNWKIIWIGSNKAFAKEKAMTLDFQLFPKMGVKCYSIQSGKLQRRISLNALLDLTKVPIGFLQSFRILKKEKPDIVLSFGGYSALPVTWAASIINIPVLIHEQTVAIGLANKLSLPFVDEVLLSRKQSKKYFGDKKTKIVGLPLHKALLKIKRKSKDKPASIYVTGGSRGSQILNSVVKEILPQLLKEYEVVHQTGSIDESSLLSFRETLQVDLRKKYTVKAHIEPMDVAKVYENADIVIGRAGAHTVAEVISLGKAAIFIPIPWVQMNEQKLNALLAKKYSQAIVIDENDLSAGKLRKAILSIQKNWKKRASIQENTISKRDRNAAGEIVSIMEQYVQ